jgi:hypothetical protein
MIRIPPDLSDTEVLEIVIGLIDLLARGDIDRFAEEAGYSFSFGASPAECVRSAISNYRSPEWYPGVEHFAVTAWHEAAGGNPEPQRDVLWYEPNESLGGTVTIDLPLNGRWSNLQADFVMLVQGEGDPFVLRLEEIYSWRQRNRDYEASSQP